GGRKKRDQHAGDESKILGIAEHAERQPPQTREINRQQSKDRTELNQDGKGLAEVLVIKSKEVLDQKQMPGRTHGKIFGQAFDNAENRRFDQIEQKHTSAPFSKFA